MDVASVTSPTGLWTADLKPRLCTVAVLVFGAISNQRPCNINNVSSFKCNYRILLYFTLLGKIHFLNEFRLANQKLVELRFTQVTMDTRLQPAMRLSGSDAEITAQCTREYTYHSLFTQYVTSMLNNSTPFKCEKY